MCATCGCGEGERRIEGDERHQEHDHHHDGHHHYHDHSHAGDPAGCVIVHHHHYHGPVHNHYYAPAAVDEEAFRPAEQRQDLHYGRGAAGSHAPGVGQRRLVQIEMDVLSKNNQLAEHNRQHFAAQRILALNLVSSPGSGKTSLLTATLHRLADKISCAVIEGDQQTTNDAERIRATGVDAIQVNTGKGCHLDAQMVHDATHRLQLADGSLLFIENVGNLVCPAGFDLGEKHKVVVLSVTEGEDKPLKYPHMFAAATLMVVNKTDLLPYLDFDLDACIANARRINPDIQTIALSSRNGEGMAAWLDWLEAQRCA